jgi:threonine dehydratase
MTTATVLDFDGVRAAAARIAGVVHRTPVLTSRTLDARTGGSNFLKAECFQRGGSFKLRGAYNKIASLSSAELERGVVAFSSGNHAQAVAIAVGLLGTRATVVMPSERRPPSSPRPAATEPRSRSTIAATTTARRSRGSSRSAAT